MNKIGWCTETWNPVIGCKNNCSYCYAKRINDRFKFIKNWNIPEWREKSFNRKFPKKPQKIFIGSMSEINYWKPEWMVMVLNKIRECPQHTFQFLTKFPHVYLQWIFPKNCWLGKTITKNEELCHYDYFSRQEKKHIKYISIEPLLEEITFLDGLMNYDWVIIGAESGNRKGKVIPKKEWVLNIVEYCDLHKIPIYIKDNLSKYYPYLKDKKEFPDGL